MFKNILVPYDLSEPSKKALEWGVFLGGNFGSELTVTSIVIQDARLIAYDFQPHYQDAIDHIKKEIDQDVKIYLKEGGQKKLGKVHIEAAWGDPASTIIKKIQATLPDLVITGTHGRTGLKHFFLGSTAEKIVRGSLSPVLVVRGNPSWPPKKILVPVDFTEYTSEALLIAEEFKQFGKPQIEIFHALGLPDIVDYAPHVVPYTPDNLLDQMQDNAKKKLQELALQHKALEAKTSLDVGPATDLIIKKAKAINADLIIMPTHGRKLLSHLLMGSIAEHVVRYAPCSVLSFCPKNERKRKGELLG